MCGYFFDKSNRDAALWFIRSIWPIIKRKNSNIICQFVGKGIENEIKQAADKDPSIELISDVDDLRPYRKGADIFVNPMRLGSGLRIKLLEAMEADYLLLQPHLVQPEYLHKMVLTVL